MNFDDFEILKLLDYHWSRIKNEPGVYVVRWLENGTPKHLQRLNGIDTQGILGVGKGKNVRKRIKQFLDDIRTNDLEVKYHSGGWNFRKYFRDNTNPNAIRPKIENIEILWKRTKSEFEADQLETKLIQEYVMNFQDKLPLNISIKRVR